MGLSGLRITVLTLLICPGVAEASQPMDRMFVTMPGMQE